MGKKKQQEAEAPKLIKLDIACGQTKPEGWVGVDIAAGPNVDVVHNLNHYPWPFADNSVEEARCLHYIEHIPVAYWHPGNKYSSVQESPEGVDALCKFWDELYRILTPGAKAYIVTPYYSSQRAWQDPTHRRAICDATYYYVSRQWREINKLDHYGITCDFDAVWGYGYDQEAMLRSDDWRAFATKAYLNTVMDIHATLTKK